MESLVVMLNITNDFHSIGKGIYDRRFSYLWTKHYPLKYVTNFSYGLIKLIEKHNACCILLWRSQRLLYLYQNHYTIVAFLIENRNACCIFCLKITTLATSFWRSLHLLHFCMKIATLAVFVSKITTLATSFLVFIFPCRYLDIIRCITTREIRRA